MGVRGWMSPNHWDERVKGYNNIDWVRNPSLLSWLTGRIREEMPRLSTGQEGPLQVLDLGCGTGAWLPRFVYGCKVTAIDLSPEMIAEAQENLRASAEDIDAMGVEWVCANWEDFARLNAETGRQWDVVISRMLLHHTQSVEMAVNAWSGLVRPGGLLAIAEGPPPVADDRHPATDLYRACFALKEPGRLILHTHDIVTAMHDAGLAEVAAFERFSEGNSLERWLRNTNTEPLVADAVRRLHETAADDAKRAYQMKGTPQGMTMRWRHNLVLGWKGHQFTEPG